MARYHENIEPSAFRPGEYVGYACGEVFHISRDRKGWWRIVSARIPVDPTEAIYTHRPTLKACSLFLRALNEAFLERITKAPDAP